MRMPTTIAVALESLARHRLRSLLAMLGVGVGILAVSCLISIGRSVGRFVSLEVAALGPELITVEATPRFEPGARQAQLLDGDLDALRLLPNVVAADGEYRADAELRAAADGEAVYAPVVGVGPSYQARQRRVLLGRFLGPEDGARHARVAVLNEGLARALFPDGRVIGRAVRVDGVPFEVVGVVAGVPCAGEYGTGCALAPLATVRERLRPPRQGGPAQLTRVLITVGSTEGLEAARLAISAELERRHGESPGAVPAFTVVSAAETAAAARRLRDGMGLMLGAIGAVALLVGGIGTMNVMLASVAERTQEIGLRRAVGARRGDILAQFLAEALALTVGGALAGLLASPLALAGVAAALPGLLAAGGLGDAGGAGLRLELDPLAGLAGLVAAILVGLAAGVYPAAQASRLTPLAAMRGR